MMAFQATIFRPSHGIDQAGLLDEQAERHGRNGAGQNEQRHAPVIGQPAAQQVQPAYRQVEDVAPEIGDHGEERAHVHHDVDDQPLVRPSGERRNQDEVAR
jgi:hypothetical protein